MKIEESVALLERVKRGLGAIEDPGTGVNILALGLIRHLAVTEEGAVSIELRPSSPQCPVVAGLAVRIKEAVGALEGITGVTIRVTGHRMAQMLNVMLADEGDGA